MLQQFADINYKQIGYENSDYEINIRINGYYNQRKLN